MTSRSKYKFAIELMINYPETIEERCLAIFSYLRNNYSELKCMLTSLEATGEKGREISKELEETNEIPVDIKQITQIFDEDGQVLEFNLILNSKDFDLWILIRDGQHANIVSNNYSILDKQVIGEFIFLGLDLFGGGNSS